MITLYTTPNCPRCRALKKWLEQRGIDFVERNLSDPKVMTDLIMRDVYVFTAPLLEVNGRLYSERELFENSGSLKEEFLKAVLKEVA